MKTILISIIIVLTTLSGHAQPNPNTMETTATQKQAIQEVVTAIFVSSDERNWAAVENAFAPKVLLDYTSMAGGDPATLTPHQITDSWKSVLPGFQHTHHMISNFEIEVEGTEATVSHYGNAQHYLNVENGEDLWSVVGTYGHHLVLTEKGWKVDRMTFNLKYMKGNMDLPRIAQENVQQTEN